MYGVSILEQSDATLVVRCRAGDPDGWRSLVARFSRYVYAICSQGYRLGPEEAEDVFQEVFARAYEQLDRLRDDAAIRPWLAQMTRRLCIDHIRARRHDDPTDVEEAAGTDATIEYLDEALVVREALQSLSPECQDILDRFFARGESYRTISDGLGLPGGAVASRISRCLKRLRDQLEGMGRNDRH
jgi:RNA polymerase sigma factor (sigma-70 family)